MQSHLFKIFHHLAKVPTHMLCIAAGEEGMTDWWSLYKQDLARYQEYRQGVPLFILLLTEQGLWAILYYRVASTLYRSCLPWVVKQPLLILAVLWQKIIEMTTGISIPYTAIIGPGF